MFKRASSESRYARQRRAESEAFKARQAEAFKDAERDSKERTARFWSDYEATNGPGSVDWS
ncbi:MAG TPA: hypothetical protein VK659_09740 [Asanoa sp.]|nr:hypothetical protein [Asanoa sp.]